MKNILRLIIAITVVSCNQNKTEQLKTNKADQKEVVKSIPSIPVKEVSNERKVVYQPYNIVFDSNQVSKYTIESRDLIKSKAIIKNVTDYSTKELEDLPYFQRLTLGIVVPFDLSQKSLINTMKSIVDKESKSNNDIDEILIFAYDDKKDLTNGGGFYTFGKLFWGPNGKTGNVTPIIAESNIRTSYKFELDIKDKVGKISKSDLPTKRELDIYNEIMAEENIGMDEDKLNKKVMKKFNIKTIKELDAIWLKVAAYKN